MRRRSRSHCWRRKKIIQSSTRFSPPATGTWCRGEAKWVCKLFVALFAALFVSSFFFTLFVARWIPFLSSLLCFSVDLTEKQEKENNPIIAFSLYTFLIKLYRSRTSWHYQIGWNNIIKVNQKEKNKQKGEFINLLREKLMSGLVILVKDIKSHCRSNRIASKERRKPHPQYVSHVFVQMIEIELDGIWRRRWIVRGKMVQKCWKWTELDGVRVLLKARG